MNTSKKDMAGSLSYWVHKPASNGVYPLVSSLWDRRAMGGSILGLLPRAIFRVPFLC